MDTTVPIMKRVLIAWLGLFLFIGAPFGESQGQANGHDGSAIAQQTTQVSGMRRVQKRREEPWKKWARNPLHVKLRIGITNLRAETNSVVSFNLSPYVQWGCGAGCETPTNIAPFTPSINVKREYLLTVVSTNLLAVELGFEVQPPPMPMSAEGADRIEKQYTILIDGQPATSINIYNATNGCGYFSNQWRIEVRDEKLAHWYEDDQSDDPLPAPGDGTFISIGPSKSTNATEVALDWSVSLGRLYDGLAAGRLRIRESGLSRSIYTPSNLYYTARSRAVREQVELVTSSADGVLRQVRAYQTFVDIQAVNSNRTDLKFYFPSQVATNKDPNGVYTNITGYPFVTWSVINPEPNTTNRLEIVEQRNGRSSTNALSFDPSSSAWTLRSGFGDEQRVETRAIAFNYSSTTDRVETVTVQYATSSVPAYHCVETYRFFPWGCELKQTAIDPDNNPGTQNDLVTTFDYYDDPDDPVTYGKLRAITHPDGFWELRLYNREEWYPVGVLKYIVMPDKNEPAFPEEGQEVNLNAGHVVEYYPDGPWTWLLIHSYGGALSYDTNNCTRWEVVSSYPWFNDTVESWEGLFAPAINDTLLGIGQTRYTDEAGKGRAGHPLEWTDSKGPWRSSYYHAGTYDANTRMFEVAQGGVQDGPDWRQSTIFWGRPNHLLTLA